MLSPGEYFQRIAALFAGVSGLLGGPVAAQTFDPLRNPLEFGLSASTGGLLVVAIATFFIYQGWASVGSRLLSAAVEYEETGWYDGQIFVKPPEILARDRLLGLYTVAPILAQLRTTLIGAGVTFVVVAGTLAGLLGAEGA